MSISVGGALALQAAVLGVIAVVMACIAADTRYGATHRVTATIAWLTFAVGLASALGSIWLAVAA